MKRKDRIWYSRTYRRMEVNYIRGILFMALIGVPCLLLLVFNLETITRQLNELTVYLIGIALPDKVISLTTSEYPPFGTIYTLDYDVIPPGTTEIALNILVSVIIIVILVLSPLRGRPVMIYLLFSFMVHIISCVYCFFAEDEVIYTGTDFSNLQIKQQIGIWILFIVLAGLVFAFLSGREWPSKIIAFFAVLIYSALVGVLRSIIFNYLLARFSSLYMADMFFVAGSMYDFLYLVAIYAVYQNHIQNLIDSPEGRYEWKWL